MDDSGSVRLKRTGKTEVSVLAATDTGDRRQADTLGRRKRHMLELDKSITLFDMEKFQRNLAESYKCKQGSTDRRELELQVGSV